ncbi:tRNA-splicing ligase RtcB [Hydrogenivirga caldilitoris]|uniref:tRNA-splicing ligase RtcB n=1 Tax=Hydrogenivirga caldilitoris TaxID=246264 RepID=A0A497XQ91_9AQUI|nr:RtcB family protein [Hydrogenivirga caldilitoris]RLJ70424.1 tRNA-splicing ligase RtcB [Hydrogenivirga caldilitoris]
MGLKEQLVRKGDYVWELPKNTVNGQKVPVIIYLSDALFELLEEDAIKQAANAATLRGVQKAIYVMPDVHVGYGFPVGGVMATDTETGIISPGSVGYDINCGVRLIATNLQSKDVAPKIKELMQEVLKNVPAGVGSTGDIRLSPSSMEEVLVKGAKWAVEHGYGLEEDLEHIESFGSLPNADPSKASHEAYERGSDELGTVGSGNHFVEVQMVEEIYDEEIAQKLGLHEGQVTIMVHSGSRGFGHQVCTDYLKVAVRVLPKYGIELPDPQLACMPFLSNEGQDYFKAMCAAANYAFANRQILGFKTANTVRRFLGLSWEEFGYRLIYDHAHNIAKIEEHRVGSKLKKVVVHRKGATRAFPPYNPEVPPAYREVGQPVIIPGDMGRASYLLVGQPDSMEKSFGTACHGAGRVMSRRAAKRLVKEQGLERVIAGLTVVARGKGTIMEEIPQAYKDVSEVVRVIHELGIAKMVARLKPLGTLKG